MVLSLYESILDYEKSNKYTTREKKLREARLEKIKVEEFCHNIQITKVLVAGLEVL